MIDDETRSEMARLYDAAFFAEWGAANEAYVRSARAAAEIVFEQYRPATVLDLGCGAGFHATRLAELGVRVIAADFVSCPPAFRAPDLPAVEMADLAAPLPPDRFPRVDLVLCLDVAEHLAPEAAPIVVANCTRFSDLVVFSAAPPGQGGIGHINEQPRRYWFERFRNENFRHCRRESGWIDIRALARRDVLTLRWMATQLAVYRRGARWPYPKAALPASPP
ncbi:MAG: class I SAM-dependent methyltransferase [Myxococcales bacterium]|nr:MAG: class I SAM-dependent methyltransferase [Myxococcales bacterium]